MSARRDPLSVQMDRQAWRALMAARRKHREGGGWVRVWVPSPARDLRALDPGGLTRHERAFRRALYYPVVQAPRRLGQAQVWSLRTEMVDGFVNRRGRWGRWCRVRLYRYGSGYRKVASSPRTSYVHDPSLRSQIGDGGVRVIPRAS